MRVSRRGRSVLLGPVESDRSSNRSRAARAGGAEAWGRLGGLPLHAGGVAVRFGPVLGWPGSGLARYRVRTRIERFRAISTGRLHGLLRFHLRPIDVVVFHGSRRDLVLRGASRLDAFSGYPVRT